MSGPFPGADPASVICYSYLSDESVRSQIHHQGLGKGQSNDQGLSLEMPLIGVQTSHVPRDRWQERVSQIDLPGERSCLQVRFEVRQSQQPFSLPPPSPTSLPWWLTSSTGSSFSLGRELESRPTRKGVGQQTMSIMEAGRTGMNVCCQEKG